jgi:formylglycine-generating enzyme required for sulfatase activity
MKSLMSLCLFVLLFLPPPLALAQDCVRTGCAPEDLDAHGCCPAAPPPPVYVAPAPVAPVGCPSGMEKGADTSGHCCWPMQAWNGARCVGTPSCPSPLVVSGESCAKPSCPEGQVRMSDGLSCCWPQQAWSSSRGECLGTPVCPAGFVTEGADCVSQAEADRRAEALRRTGIEWVRIPGGTFEMGSTKADDEQPVHAVRVSSFELMKTEVTVGQYRLCVEAGACTAPDAYDPSEASLAHFCSWGQSGREDHPVNCVGWDQAQSFASWAGGRLPTEAEWEYAARSGGQSWTYPWGNEEPTCSRAVMADGDLGCGQSRTWPVCSKPAGNSTQGVCDLSGNVWEWVQDTWHDNYRGAPGDGTAWDTGASSRVFRGGSWSNAGSNLRASYRRRRAPSRRRGDLGFRLARSNP